MKLDKETETNIKALIKIRDDVETSPAVRIQAIQTMQKIIDALGANTADDRPSEADIMKKIRGAKK
jgi:hypothetical protein